MASTKFQSKKNLVTLLANMKKGRSDLIRWSEEDKAAEDKATEVLQQRRQLQKRMKGREKMIVLI